MRQHTPGPWLIMPGFGAPRICAEGNSMQPIVVAIGGPSDEAMNANQCLISAAPDLLEALKAAEMEIVEYLETLPKPHDCENTLNLVRAAIAKATGGAE